MELWSGWPRCLTDCTQATDCGGRRQDEAPSFCCRRRPPAASAFTRPQLPSGPPNAGARRHLTFGGVSPPGLRSHSRATFMNRLYVNQPSPVMKICGLAVAASRMTPTPSLYGV